MFGLDERIAACSHGSSAWIVLALAVLLGLRHATDPDHLAAVMTLVASGGERAARRAGELGLAWGVGHALTLFAFGLPIILFNSLLPPRVQQGAETAIGCVIVFLALRLLVRWRRGELRADGHAHRARTRRGAFAIGLVHGMGGSAGVGVLVLASVRTASLAVTSLVLLAVFTAASMSIMSRVFGSMLVSRPARSAFGAVAAASGGGSLAFGVWYATAAWRLIPYPF